MKSKILCIYHAKDGRVLRKLVDGDKTRQVSFEGHDFEIIPEKIRIHWDSTGIKYLAPRFEMIQDCFEPASKFRKSAEPITVSNFSGAFDKSQFNKRK